MVGFHDVQNSICTGNQRSPFDHEACLILRPAPLTPPSPPPIIPHSHLQLKSSPRLEAFSSSNTYRIYTKFFLCLFIYFFSLSLTHTYWIVNVLYVGLIAMHVEIAEHRDSALNWTLVSTNERTQRADCTIWEQLPKALTSKQHHFQIQEPALCSISIILRKELCVVVQLPQAVL